MRMCERWKIANTSSILTNDALTWCESVYVNDKSRTWSDMKMLMRDKFDSQSQNFTCKKDVDDLEEQHLIVLSLVTSPFKDNISTLP